MASHVQQCAELDSQTKHEAQSRSVFDPELRRLRAALRSECEAALLADYRLSQVILLLFPIVLPVWQLVLRPGVPVAAFQPVASVAVATCAATR